MNIISYIILGIVQGFTEPIPVSSSGHLILFRRLLNLDFVHDLNFEIIVNFGSFIAIVYFYRKDLIELFHDFFMFIKTKKKTYEANFKYALLIVLATIPAAIIGLLYKRSIEGLSYPKIVGVALLMTAGLIFIIRKLKGKKDDKDITTGDAIYIGIFQALALLPGLSRSGCTLAAGMFRDLKRDVALKFSFMLYIPISIGAMILGMKDFVQTASIDTLWLAYLLGMIASGIVTFYSLRWFKNTMLHGKLIYFVYYCIVVGTLVLIFM
jgi:undecaprenyl-diphosphatase